MNFSRKPALILFMFLFVFTLSAQENDLIHTALKKAGLMVKDLGYEPKGYWARYPNPDIVPHKLPFFDDLFKEPLQIYNFTKTLGITVDEYLNPKYLNENTDALFKLILYLGVDKKIGGFRGYDLNLIQKSSEKEPILNAIKEIYDYKGLSLIQKSFGNISPWLNYEKEIREKCNNIPVSIQKPCAKLILNILDSYIWWERAVRNCSWEKMTKVFTIKNLGTSMIDGLIYEEELDDLSNSLDEYSLYYSGMKAAEAGFTVSRELKKIVTSNEEKYKDIHFEFKSPIGRIVISGTGNDTHKYIDCAVLIDLGGNDNYKGPCGAVSSLNYPVSVSVDLSGDDMYKNEIPDIPSQGAGVLGSGILIDCDGNDTYEDENFAQGAGLLGLGVLFDEKGDDKYKLKSSGQGTGYFGIGMLLEGEGKDEYNLKADGQGYGSAGGIGVIADRKGNDRYFVDPVTENWIRPDYHSKYKITHSNAQGAGSGRRGDGSDGKCWAGGLGALIDIYGNDYYESGNSSLGYGYWYGTGTVYEGGGDDTYKSCYFTQGAGAHFCIGALIDEGGNDKHILFETSGACLAFSWDYTISMLIDKGGDDYFEAKGASFGCAEIRSNAFFINTGGNDTYKYGSSKAMGISPFKDFYKSPSAYSRYNSYSNSFGLFLDVEGKDEYVSWNVKKNKTTNSEKFRNNSIWFNPPRDSKEYGFNSYGVGMDKDRGIINFIGYISEK